MSRRTIVVVIGALALLVALTPLVPHGQRDEGRLRPSRDTPAAATGAAIGPSRVTPAMRAEITRVVDAGRSVGRVSGRITGRLSGGKAGLVAATRSLVRCADFSGQRYCLGSGWTEDTQAQVQDRVAAAARTALRTPGVEQTGDLGAAAELTRLARMDPSARATAERTELEDAARGVGKVWLLRHQIEGVAIPASVTAGNPSLRTAAARSTKPYSAYPRTSRVINADGIIAQKRTYWCGPTAMQMIAYGWSRTMQSQKHWSRQLGTNRSGTGITSMVHIVNRDTGWDNANRAGPYITLDVGKYSFRKWMLLMMRHVHDYRAPVVLHPILLKRFYPYLDDDASGHFQVGRGYDKRGKRPDRIGYFEPWNQQAFDPSEPYIKRVQWRDAYKSYRANLAHFQHNVGV